MSVGAMELGDAALRYAREELKAGGQDFDGPLASRLIHLAAGPPFSLLEPETRARTHDFRRGGVDDGRSDECLARAISRWLAETPVGTDRLLLLEDPLARRADIASADDAVYHGDRVYYAGVSGDAPDRIERAFRRLAGYPGIGVLTELPTGAADSVDLAEQTLNLLSDAASAVLVRAWDDEAFIVVPVDGRLAPQDLRC